MIPAQTILDQGKRVPPQYQKNCFTPLGRTGILLNSMNRELKTAIKGEQYEECLKIRSRIQTLQYLIQNRSFERYDEHDFNNSEESLQALFTLISPISPPSQILIELNAMTSVTSLKSREPDPWWY